MDADLQKVDYRRVALGPSAFVESTGLLEGQHICRKIHLVPWPGNPLLLRLLPRNTGEGFAPRAHQLFCYSGFHCSSRNCIFYRRIYIQLKFMCVSSPSYMCDMSHSYLRLSSVCVTPLNGKSSLQVHYDEFTHIREKLLNMCTLMPTDCAEDEQIYRPGIAPSMPQFPLFAARAFNLACGDCSLTQ